MRIYKLRLSLTLFCGLGLLLTGCASLEGGRVTVVGSRRVEYVFRDGPGPAVIFENGLGGRYDWWAKIFPEIAKTQRAFAYNRPGYGQSDTSAMDRDGRTIVEELRETLASLNIKPPYILVGHSAGGLYFQDFARRYPGDVIGLILVDSTHPLQMTGAGAVQNWPWWVRTVLPMLTPRVGMEELGKISRSGEEVLSLPPLDTDRIKTVILVASDPKNPDTPLAVHAQEMRKDFRRLYPNAEFVTVDGDHAIPLHSPQIVLAQIRKVIAFSR